MIKTAVMGYSTTGSGVAKILDENRGVVTSQAGQEVELKYVLDLREFPDSPVTDGIVHDFKVIEQDEEVKIVVEIVGELNPAYSFMKACLMAGKNIVTSSKVLMAAHGTELLTIARKKHVSSFFEVSVGGGIPIIRPLYRCLMGERIEEITGILNGTTNFILTKMDEERESFESALEEAQDLGYVEHNPETDVEGHDTCHKIAILTAMVMRKEINYEDVYTEGIARITDINFRYAEEMGASVELFGTSRIKGDRILAYMTPVIINKTNPLYSVNDIFNGILMKGNMLGTSMFYGGGAGKLPTGNTVVADVIEAAQNLKKSVPMGWIDERQATESMDQTQFRYFVKAADFCRNKEQDAKNAFGQVEVVEFYRMGKFTFLTARMAEGEFRKAAASYDSREWERSEYGIKQMIHAMLQHMVLVVSRIIGEIARQGFLYLFHLLTGLYCSGYGSTRMFRALLAGNLLLSIRYHPLVAHMAMVLTAELVSLAVSRVAKNPRYYLGHERLLACTGAVAVLMSWVYKNYMLVVRGVDLLPLWPR